MGEQCHGQMGVCMLMRGGQRHCGHDISHALCLVPLRHAVTLHRTLHAQNRLPFCTNHASCQTPVSINVSYSHQGDTDSLPALICPM